MLACQWPDLQFFGITCARRFATARQVSPQKPTWVPSRNMNSTFLTSSILILCCILAGSLTTNAQLFAGSGTCDSVRLIRCQQDVLRDLQSSSLNEASIQYPIGGPPYSPIKQHQLLTQSNPTTCRLIRSNLDCLLTTTPACYDQGIQTAQNTDVILRAKRYLEQNGCNSEGTWHSTFCYRSPEVRACEDRYGFTGSSSASVYSNNVTACLAYNSFKTCIDSYLRLNCKIHEIDMVNEYLIDRSSDLAWRCPANFTANLLASNPYQLNNRANTVLSPSVSNYNNYGSYDQRPIPTYVGSSAGNINLFRDQAWERFGNPVEDTRSGFGRFPGGEVLDRLVGPSGFEVDNSDCPVRAAPFARECEDTLLDQQRLARDSRDGIELQRRVCCSLFQYRDCVSRVVLDRCADSSPTAVEILMGGRRREMTLTCKGFNRDVCSGSLSIAANLNLPVILGAITLALLTAFNHQKQQSHTL